MAVDDVIVVGAGHNGLTCAAFLARSGLGVTVLEANGEAGGCIWTETLRSGHRLERGAIDHSLIVDVANELGLSRFGLRYEPREELLAAGFADGGSLRIARDLDRTVGRIDEVFPGEGQAYRRLAELADLVFGFVDQQSPPRFADVVALADAVPGDEDLVRLLVASSESVLASRLTNPRLRSIVAMAGAHNQLPPWMPGTGLFALLGPSMHGGTTARPVGGSAALIRALSDAIVADGGRVVTGAAATAIRRTADTFAVSTDVGTFTARKVVSSIDAIRTAQLVDGSLLPVSPGTVRTGAFNVAELKVDIALDRPATIGFGDQSLEALWLLQEHERSLSAGFADIVAGRMPRSPAMMWASPSASDPTAAPPGAGTVWLSTFVPATVEDGGWDEAREERAADALLEGVRRISGVDLAPVTVERRVTSPRTWRSRIGGDNPNHLDLTLDQLFAWRPPGSAGYRTSVPDLYLTGAGSYPGGGLTGVPGRNAAHALLRDVHGRRRPFRRAWTASVRETRMLRRALGAYLAMRRRS